MNDETPELLLSHFEDPYHRGECDRPTYSHQAHDVTTGHFIAIQLRVDEDHVVAEAWFDSAGCLFCEAPASVLVQRCEGMSLEGLMEADERDYLKWTHLDRVSASPNCSHLAWLALQNALKTADPAEYEPPMFGGPSLGEES